MRGTNYEVPHFSLLHSPFNSFGSKYSPQYPVFKYLHSSLNVRDHVSSPYSKTGNIIILLRNTT